MGSSLVMAALRELVRVHVDAVPLAVPLAARPLAGVHIAAVFAVTVVGHGGLLSHFLTLARTTHSIQVSLSVSI